jgi:hypothetical protein
MTTESDRELLELAAKAAGIDVRYMPLSGFNIVSGPRAGQLWNPLDIATGDALRLAVKLHISFWRDSLDACCSWAPIGQNPFAEGMKQLAEDIGDNPEAATCRAIVWAAADVGRHMK